MERPERRKTVYKPGRREQDLEEQENKKITRLLLDDMIEKEKQSEIKSLRHEAETKKLKTLTERFQRERVPFEYISRPSASRFSIAPAFSETEDLEFRAIEKSAFGNYILLKFLESKPDTSNDACFIYPDLDLAILAIQLFYLFRKFGIRLPKEALEDWDAAEEVMKQDKQIYKIYKLTKDLVKRNLDSFQEYLKFNENGSRLSKASTKKIQEQTIDRRQDQPTETKQVKIYDYNLFSLLMDILYSDNFSIDTNSEPYTVHFPSEQKLRKCLDSGKRFIVMFLSIILENSGHANMIIIDKQKGTMERYEPQGLDHGFYDSKQVDQEIKKVAKKYNLSYLGPDDFCITGLQDIMEQDTMDIYYFEGFCKTWSFMYALLRLMVGDEMDTQDFNENLHDIMVYFAKEFLEERTGKKIDPKNYNFVIEFLYEYLPEILESGNVHLEKINQKLGTNLVLKGKTIYLNQ
jgi:hypothetical protein